MSMVYYILLIAGLISAVVCMTIAIIVFNKENIRKVIGDLNGSNAQKAIKAIKEEGYKKVFTGNSTNRSDNNKFNTTILVKSGSGSRNTKKDDETENIVKTSIEDRAIGEEKNAIAKNEDNEFVVLEDVVVVGSNNNGKVLSNFNTRLRDDEVTSLLNNDDYEDETSILSFDENDLNNTEILEGSEMTTILQEEESTTVLSSEDGEDTTVLLSDDEETSVLQNDEETSILEEDNATTLLN